MQGDIVSQGLLLMLYGMGTVVVFLSALVLATTAMSRCIARFFPGPPAPASPTQGARSGPDRRLAAVIAAAVHRYRSRHPPR